MPQSFAVPLLAFLRRLLDTDARRRAAAAPGGADAAAPANPGNSSSLDSVSSVSNNRSARTIGPDGIALIKRFEGCARLRADGLIEAYPDPGSGGEPWTIGWGATGRDRFSGGRIGPGTVWTQDQCDARLAEDLQRCAAEVSAAIGPAPTSQRQFDALVSFHYNTGAIARATLTAKHVAGDFAGAAQEFARWNRAGGKVMKGLVRRRDAEAALYRS
jgi:GH24 family phage-related lysozyme (muramidase)